MNDDSMTSDEVFEAISHPMRIEILRLLARKPVRFADLKRKLRIESSGQLDFHLKKMTGIVVTDSDGNYTLNDRGYAALTAVDMVSRHGWQRRAYIIAFLTYAVMNVYFILMVPLGWWFVIFLITTAWILFYSYWTFIKRRIRLRRNGEISNE
ncbi:MAG: winged helix-turn-helix transcriptional regulator [Candidatus Thorarchaeota archaeon]|nr:MAG: winged helix-turn-helix transcriptional regulator [Candidatus Thorarchaeota archaeon]